jgi:SOS-response transcriptional repressor LexA
MPHALTDRQREYLAFIRDYVKKNESSPRLEEIADHFNVTSPTAHNTLKALMKAGYLYFGRSKTSGFFIRLVERAGTSEMMIEVPIAGKVNRYGELKEFPQNHGHFATLLLGANPGEVFALMLEEDIPEASMLAGDLLICDYGKRAQPGDIAILPFDGQATVLFLCSIISFTLDKDMPSLEVSNPYPRPETTINKEYGQKLNWVPIGYDQEDTEEYYVEIGRKLGTPMFALPPELVVATVLRLTRNLAF